MSDIKDKIDKVSTTILENWAMFMVEPNELNIENLASDKSYYCSVLRFKGNKSGNCSIVCEKEFMNLLVENVFGMDEEVSEEEFCDALGELSNIFCGNLLTEVYGTDSVFELNAPEVKSVKFDEINKNLTGNVSSCLADDEPVYFCFEEGK